MASTIKLKRGSGEPGAGALVEGEPAFDLTNKRLYTENTGGTVIEVGTNPTTLQVDGTLTVGVDDTGYDVEFFGATTGKSMLWDESADSLIVTGTTTLVGTTNLDAVDIDDAVQIDGTVSVGVDGTGFDVAFYGDTAGKYMLWDQSADSLIVEGDVFIGYTANVAGAPLQVNTAGTSTLGLSAWQNPSHLAFRRSNNATIGGNTTVADNDVIGKISFLGADGSNYEDAAFIQVAVDGTLGTDTTDMPARIEFATSADNSDSPTTRMTIDSSGRVIFGDPDGDISGLVFTGLATTDPVINTNATGAEFVAYRTDNAVNDGDFIGAYLFGNDDNDATEDHFAGIWAKATGTAGSMDLHFAAGKAGYEADSAQMTLSSAGELGIGTTAPALDLHVVGADGVGQGVPSFNADSVAVFQNNGLAGDAAVVHIISGTTGNAFIAFGDKDDSIMQTITANQADGDLKFATGNAALAMTITSGGNTCLGTITTPMQDFGADKTTLALKGRGATDYSVIQMGNGGTSGNNQVHGQIAFYDVHSGSDLRVSAISSYREISTNSSYLSFGTSPGSAGLTEAMRIDRAGAVKIFGDLNHVDNGGTSRILYDKSGNLLGNTGTNVTCATLSKASGSFKIDHPLESKTDTHHLIHSFVESPTADNIYRGKIALVLGSATVNIDTAAGMTDGTFAALNREVQCFTSNESGWTAVKGSVSGNTLTITAQEDTCTDTVSWLVVGERKDPHMYATDWTDENGKVIVEPLKPVIEETEEETP